MYKLAVLQSDWTAKILQRVQIEIPDPRACALEGVASPDYIHSGSLPLAQASSVSPDTVSFLNVSTRFYLGVHAVRNIATTSELGSSID